MMIVVREELDEAGVKSLKKALESKLPEHKLGLLCIADDYEVWSDEVKKIVEEWEKDNT